MPGFKPQGLVKTRKVLCHWATDLAYVLALYVKINGQNYKHLDKKHGLPPVNTPGRINRWEKACNIRFVSPIQQELIAAQERLIPVIIL